MLGGGLVPAWSFRSIGGPDTFKLVRVLPIVNDAPPVLGGSASQTRYCSAPDGSATGRIQVWPVALARYIDSAVAAMVPIPFAWALPGPSQRRRFPGGSRAVGHGSRVAHGPSLPGRHTGRRSPGSMLAVSARLTHGPSEPEWRPGRQSPGGARAVSSPSGSRAVTVSPRGGSRAVSPPVAHGPSVPERRTGHQYPSGARAVSPPGRLAHGSSVLQVAHGPSVPKRPCVRCGYRPLVGPEVVALFDRNVSVLVVD